MAYFAQIDNSNVVISVEEISGDIIIDENGIENENLGVTYLKNIFGENTIWKMIGSIGGFRKNFPSIGFSYDQELDAFISPKPFNSWILNRNTAMWEAPIQQPDLKEYEIINRLHYIWDEEKYKVDNSSGWILKENFF